MKTAGSINKNVGLIELLDVRLDFCQLLLIALLPALQSEGVHQMDVSQLLVLVVDFIPLVLEALPDLVDLYFRKAVVLDLVLGVQVLDHLVLVVDVVLDPVQVVRSPPVVLLLGPVGFLGRLLGCRQDVLNRIRNDEVLAALEPLHRLLVHGRHWSFLVGAVVREFVRHGQLLVPHGACILL